MKIIKYICVYVLLGILTQSCYYRPFLGYITQKKDFKHFSKKERSAGDNQSVFKYYDVKYYDWSVDLDPVKKHIRSTMIIHLLITQDTDQIMLNFDGKSRISLLDSEKPIRRVKRRNDRLILSFNQIVKKNELFSIKINYEGRPRSIAGEGPVQWKEDKDGRPWISTITEGIGPQFLFPCNALLSDKADSAAIKISVPQPLIAVANGKLISHNISDGKNEFTYRISNPINVYNISFNIGMFDPFTIPYQSVNGTEQTLTFYPLDYQKEKAKKHYSQTPEILRWSEEQWGTFPWWNDGFSVVESTFSAMEHQSALAMGSIYQNTWKEYETTLVHEISHEWWGNLVTAQDYGDAWMHEGFATFAEALFIESIYGQEDYYKKISSFIRHTDNKLPIQKPQNVLYNSWVGKYDGDIYSKGALFLHSVRAELGNDSLFLSFFKYYREKHAGKLVDSKLLIDELRSYTGFDFSEMAKMYLQDTAVPTLQLKINSETKSVSYRWSVPPQFEYRSGIHWVEGDTKLILHPTEQWQTQKLKEGEISILQAASAYFLIEKL